MEERRLERRKLYGERVSEIFMGSNNLLLKTKLYMRPNSNSKMVCREVLRDHAGLRGTFTEDPKRSHFGSGAHPGLQ